MYHEDPDRFRAALAHAQAVSHFSQRLIEKDYYCSILLHDLAGQFDQGLVFKGGTCLSKVHAEFFRLSEDLDFCVSVSGAASMPDRRRAVAPFKDHFATVPGRLHCFQVAEALLGHNRCRQYNGLFSYRSLVTGENEFIKLEISLRETILLPTEILPARTMLLDPDSKRPAFPPVNVRVLSLREAYAEKIRAALTRREPAIRDFFDIDSAVQRGIFDHRSSDVLDLVAAKLVVFANEPIDTSDEKLRTLEGQIETHLRPVLRPQDYDLFELQRAVRLLEEVVRLCRKR